MLVLSRQRDQSIMIGDQIEIKVVDIRGEKVRLGIDAPREVKVDRKEIYDKIKLENQEAGKVQPGDVAAIMDSPPTVPPTVPPMMRMGPTPPPLGGECEEALKLILELSEAGCMELLTRIRREKPEIWKRVCGAD
jgi:carbon storage regulator